MRTGDLIVLLAARPGHLPVFLKGEPVTGIDAIGGRIRRHVMGDTFLPLPERPRDEVLVPSTATADAEGPLPGLKVRDLHRLLASRDPATEMFIDGEPVDGLHDRRGRMAESGGRRRFTPDPIGGRDVVLTFTRWTELSDGTRHLVAF